MHACSYKPDCVRDATCNKIYNIYIYITLAHEACPILSVSRSERRLAYRCMGKCWKFLRGSPSNNPPDEGVLTYLEIDREPYPAICGTKYLLFSFMKIIEHNFSRLQPLQLNKEVQCHLGHFEIDPV